MTFWTELIILSGKNDLNFKLKKNKRFVTFYILSRHI